MESSMKGLMYIVPTEPAGNYKILDPNALVYCELFDDVQVAYLEDNEKLIIKRGYKLFDELRSRTDFPLVNPQCVVNLKYIADYDNIDGVVKLKNGVNIKIAHSEKAAFLKSIS